MCELKQRLLILSPRTNSLSYCGSMGIIYLSCQHFSSVQFSSVPWPIGSSGGHEGRFSRDPRPVFSAGGHCKQFWHGPMPRPNYAGTLRETSTLLRFSTAETFYVRDQKHPVPTSQSSSEGLDTQSGIPARFKEKSVALNPGRIWIEPRGPSLCDIYLLAGQSRVENHLS